MGKKGVVRDPKTHLEVVKRVLGFAKENGFSVLHLDFSPIKGPEGNIEYLVHIKKDGANLQEECVDAAAVVAAAHAKLDK